MSYTYVSQKMREHDVYLRYARVFPEMLPEPYLQTLIQIEEGYRAGFLDRRKAVLLATVLALQYGLKYWVVSEKHIVMIPSATREFYRVYWDYPQLVALVGNRHAGKTITAWTIAYYTLKRFPKPKLYVYGDVDGISYVLRDMKEFEDRVIIKEEYSMPPKDNKAKIILYNELAEPLINKRAMSGENVGLDLQALRNRHLNAWIIYNVIRYGLFETNLRETADMKIFKWMSGDLLENAKSLVAKGWRDLLNLCLKFDRNEGLAYTTIEKKGVEFFMFHTNPPSWLLEAHKKAKKNQNLMLMKDEKKRKVLERIGELWEEGLSAGEIQLILQGEGIQLSKRSVQMKIRKWKRIMGIEDEKNK